MADTLRKGLAVPITKKNKQESTNVGNIWYTAHHGAYHPKQRNLRIDCGATYQGMPLNPRLLQAQTLPTTFLVSSQGFGAVAFITDVEAMFHQVHVPDEYTDLLDGELNKCFEKYKMVVHIFGATTSPSSATFALQQCA